MEMMEYHDYTFAVLQHTEHGRAAIDDVRYNRTQH